MSRDGRKMGKRLTPAQAAKNLARATKTATIPHRFVGTVNDVTDRETTGTVLVDCHLSTNPITVHVRANVDLAADDRIFVKRDLAMGDVYTFDGFVDGGGTGNNGAGAVIPWTQSPGVTSPPGTDLEISAPAGQTTIIGSPGDPVQFDGDVDLVLNDLADVNAGSPSDNDSLTWDTGTSRWIPEAVVSGAWPDAGKCKIGTTEYSTFALAIAAATAGNLIKVGEGSFTCDDQTVPDGVDVIGSGIGITTLTTSTQAICLRVGDASYIANLTVQNTYTGGHSYGIFQGTDADYSEFRMVRSEITNTGAGNQARTWWLCNALLVECEGVGTAASGYGFGLLSVDTTAGTVTIDGGYFYGSGGSGASDIDTLYATTTIVLNDPRLGGGGINVLNGNGTVYGSYRDTDINVTTYNRAADAAAFDYPLIDVTNASGVSSHFRDNDSSYPAGWTETDAANKSVTNEIYSSWSIGGASSETSWKYRIQTSLTLESLGASDFLSMLIGPLEFRDSEPTADVDYYFGIYRDSSGIDENTYVRAHVWWDSGNTLWKIRGEESDGSTPHTGSWLTIDQNPLYPFWVRLVIQNAAAKTTRSWFGGMPYQTWDQALLLQQAPSSAPTWGQVWVQFHQSRGAGQGDELNVGALDYTGNQG